MGRIFVNQTSLKIIVKTGVDLSSSNTTKIEYLKPNDATVYILVAEIEGDAGEGVISYTFATEDTTILSTAGTYKFWSWVEFQDTRVVRGETSELQVHSKIK